MRGNIPIPEIPHGEDLWLMVLVTSVRERRTQQGRVFCDASARNATGTLALKIWGETLETQKEIKPGLWASPTNSKHFRIDRSSSSPSIAQSPSINIASIKKPIHICRARTPSTSKQSRSPTFANASDRNSND